METLKNIEVIKTFEDACEYAGLHPVAVLPFMNPTDAEEEALNAVRKMWIIARVLNGDWKADFKDNSQWKYYPWFKADKSGFGLSYGGYGRWTTVTDCGVRFAFKDEKTAKYAGQQFIDIYNKFL